MNHSGVWSKLPGFLPPDVLIILSFWTKFDCLMFLECKWFTDSHTKFDDKAPWPGSGFSDEHYRDHCGDCVHLSAPETRRITRVCHRGIIGSWEWGEEAAERDGDTRTNYTFTFSSGSGSSDYCCSFVSVQVITPGTTFSFIQITLCHILTYSILSRCFSNEFISASLFSRHLEHQWIWILGRTHT